MNNNTAVFIYDGKEILAEITAEGTKTNIFGNNMIATTGTDTLYYQYNNHGDVVRVLDQSGTLKNEYDYDAFGNAITEKETVKNPYRYAGYYQDTESGLYYLRSRYYNPKTARFLTEDTASGKYTDPLSLNKYTYCHNQPVTGYDPDGHALHILAGAVVGGLIGGAISYASQAWKNKSFTKGIDWKQVAGGAAEGAITGAIGAATGGASLAATAATSGLKTAGKLAVKKFAINTASGFVGNTANQLISSGGKSYDIKEAITSGLTENIDIPAFQFGEKTAKKVGSEIVDKVGDSFKKKAGNEAAESAGSDVVKKTIGNSAESGMGNPCDNISLNKKVTDYSAGVHPGKVVAESQEITQATIHRALRQSKSPEGMAVDKMLKRGMISLDIKDAHSRGLAGLKEHGNNKVTIYRDATKTPQVAAGYVAHETKHYLQKLTRRTYRKKHEVEAYLFQSKVDKTFPLKTEEQIWDFVNTHPEYKNLKD